MSPKLAYHSRFILAECKASNDYWRICEQLMYINPGYNKLEHIRLSLVYRK